MAAELDLEYAKDRFVVDDMEPTDCALRPRVRLSELDSPFGTSSNPNSRVSLLCEDANEQPPILPDEVSYLLVVFWLIIA